MIVVFLLFFNSLCQATFVTPDENRFTSAIFQESSNTLYFSYLNRSRIRKLDRPTNNFAVNRSIIGAYRFSDAKTSILTVHENRGDTENADGFHLEPFRDGFNCSFANLSLGGGKVFEPLRMWIVAGAYNTSQFPSVETELKALEREGQLTSDWQVQFIRLLDCEGTMLVSLFKGSPRQKINQLWLRSSTGRYSFIDDYQSFSGTLGNHLLYFSQDRKSVLFDWKTSAKEILSSYEGNTQKILVHQHPVAVAINQSKLMTVGHAIKIEKSSILLNGANVPIQMEAIRLNPKASAGASSMFREALDFVSKARKWVEYSFVISYAIALLIPFYFWVAGQSQEATLAFIGFLFGPFASFFIFILCYVLGMALYVAGILSPDAVILFGGTLAAFAPIATSLFGALGWKHYSKFGKSATATSTASNQTRQFHVVVTLGLLLLLVLLVIFFLRTRQIEKTEQKLRHNQEITTEAIHSVPSVSLSSNRNAASTGWEITAKIEAPTEGTFEANAILEGGVGHKKLEQNIEDISLTKGVHEKKYMYSDIDIIQAYHDKIFSSGSVNVGVKEDLVFRFSVRAKLVGAVKKDNRLISSTQIFIPMAFQIRGREYKIMAPKGGP